MSRFVIVSVVGLLLSFVMMHEPLAKTFTFGDNKGEPVPTQYEIDERRIAAVTDKMATISAQLEALGKAQQQTNQYLQGMAQLASNQQQLLQQLVVLMKDGAITPAGAGAQAASPAIDGQKAAFTELSRTMHEQSETMKLLVTLVNQMANEQKVTNNLLQTYLAK
jgi:hypothetical protein